MRDIIDIAAIAIPLALVAALIILGAEAAAGAARALVESAAALIGAR